jgi:deoxyribodipyrimidine photo-lyase
MSSKSKAAAAPALISVKPERIRLLSSVKSVKPSQGGVVYWMSRDQRVQDNWALLHARQLADEHGVGLSVAFCMVPGFLGATIRHYGFMLKGLAEVEAELLELGIPFTLLQGEPGTALPDFVRRHEVAAVVSDFSPLRISRGWKDELVKALAPTSPTHGYDCQY